MSHENILGIAFPTGATRHTYLTGLKIGEVTKVESLKGRFVREKNHGDGSQGPHHKRAYILLLAL